ncbi:helix-turn-helix domain-containing protein [Rhodoferax sp.]|uniref:winged helix-turn-helix transcriptional regulator n=1 Tax=Rhodoferax sp. TaxID=50421 RepID=UPI002850F4B8|nr:helix-turn-helix domain-containing protein [Rhodoferax sp.]MDR3368240.1 helix-turn-helix domain-containing protein [Rhodoferax sp.]
MQKHINSHTGSFGEWPLLVGLVCQRRLNIGPLSFRSAATMAPCWSKNEESIASNILASRLKHLTAFGLLTRCPDPNHQQKGIYSLTEAAIQLVPRLEQMAAWGLRYTHPSEEAALRAERLEKGGSSFWSAVMDELRYLHLGAPRPAHPVLGQLAKEAKVME